ncbi:hypothetical protein EDB81DRAFT_821365 [Dactylonectria macrodidyma]|uniref:Zn(2)-C6 fungal-type domain-containing protein n=1 Tax=Dactylonectria macrodidyma TaxID=307937 RepID=A0A9P9IBK5_9HYPO|nr:hypothetical protein EDB81DRAFT_821365 [Dactylonectria macrodidyma]
MHSTRREAIAPRTTRACDRCYAIKARCQKPQCLAACVRCSRLGFECLNVRPAKKAGRAPRCPLPRPRLGSQAEETSGENAMGSSCSDLAPVLCRDPSPVDDLAPRARDLVYDLLTNDDVYDQVWVGPSFWESHRKALLSHYHRSGSTLHDAFLACALSWPTLFESSGRHGSEADASFQYASSASERLREFRVWNNHTASECLMLGSLVLTFTYWSKVPDIHTTCRQTLRLIKPFYESTLGFDDYDGSISLSSLIITELFDCLLRGLDPTFRYCHVLAPEAPPDRHLGLCTCLLPYIFDVCKINSNLRLGHYRNPPEFLEAVNPVEEAVEDWQPLIPKGFFSDFTSIEVAHMLCQAQVMRLCTLLIIYRLKYPFGVNDKMARVMAMTILTQIESTSLATKKAMNFITLPVLVACFEMNDKRERERWYNCLPCLIHHSERFDTYIQSLLGSFWTLRDVNAPILWCNLGEFLSPIL